MTAKTRCEVCINGTTYTLVGTESTEYMQELSAYINHKLQELKSTERGQFLDNQTVAVLTAINIADLLYKKDNQCRELIAASKEQESTLEQYSDDLAKAQEEIEECYKKIDELQLQLFKARHELNEFIEAFDETV